MRVVLDTNVLVSALLTPSGAPGAIYRAWLNGAFTLLMCDAQLDELRRTLRKPSIVSRYKPHDAGRMVNGLRALAEDVGPLPHVLRSSDPDDDFLLAMAETGHADYLVTGDKNGLLALIRHAGSHIVSAAEFAKLLF